MRCPYCGAENVTHANTCKHCYADLMKTCKNCRTKNDSKARFCKNCGQPLGGHRISNLKCSRCNSPIEYGMPGCPSCGAFIDWGAMQH